MINWSEFDFAWLLLWSDPQKTVFQFDELCKEC